MADDRPVAYLEDGVVIIRASALGDCSRNLWGALTGIDPAERPEWLDRAAEEGRLHEGAMADELIRLGAEFTTRQEDVEYWVIPGKLMIRGHTDGRIVYEGDWVWEAKSCSRNVFDQFIINDQPHWTAKPNYAWQISLYMAATRLPAWYTVKRRDDGLTVHAQITDPPHTEDEIRAKALTVYKAYKTGRMPDCDPVRYPCERFFLHDEDDPDPDSLYAGPSDIVDSLAAEYLTVKEACEEMDARRKKLRAMLVNTVGRGATAVTDGHRVQVIHKHRQGVSKGRFVEEYGEEAWDRMQKLCECGKLGAGFEEVRANAI